MKLGEASPGPPNDLSVYLSTLPMSMIHPPAHTVDASETTQQNLLLSPSRPLQPAVPLLSPNRAGAEERRRIETPTWVIVKPGEDDAEEAREELGSFIPGTRRVLSPIKRKVRQGHDLVSLSLRFSARVFLTWFLGN